MLEFGRKEEREEGVEAERGTLLKQEKDARGQGEWSQSLGESRSAAELGVGSKEEKVARASPSCVSLWVGAGQADCICPESHTQKGLHLV